MNTTTLKWKTHADLAIRLTREVRREEFLDHMTFRRNERPLFTEIFGPILGLKEEWEARGATPDELDFSAFRYRCEDRYYIPVNTGRQGGLPEVLIEETDEHKLWRDGLGRTMKLPELTATLPLPLDFPVKTMDDWQRLKPWYRFSADRLAGEWEAGAKAAAQAGKVVCVGIPGGIDKNVLRQSKAAIDAELERKIPPMLRTGGCVLALDHRIPNGTPLENYRYYHKGVFTRERQPKLAAHALKKLWTESGARTNETETS